MSVLVVSQKKDPYDASGITFNGEELRVLDDATLVGLQIDSKLRWGPMVHKLAVKLGNDSVHCQEFATF